MDSKQLGVSDLFRMVDQFHNSALLHFAHSAGLFELTMQSCNADELAARLGWVPRKALIFLNSLVAIGLLSKDDRGRYHNAMVADQCLVKSGSGYMGGVIEHQRRQWDT